LAGAPRWMPGSSLANLTFANDIPAEERRHCRTTRLGHDTGKIQHRHRCAAGPHCYQDVLRKRRPMNEHMARLCHQRWPKVAMECKNECVNSDGCSYVVGNERTRTTDGITNTYHHTHTRLATNINTTRRNATKKQTCGRIPTTTSERDECHELCRDNVYTHVGKTTTQDMQPTCLAKQ